MVQKAQINTAFMHISKLAEGNDPISNQALSKESVFNNPEIIRTMFVVKEILEKIKESGIPQTRETSGNDTRPVEFPAEIAEKFKSKRDTTVTHFIHDMYMYSGKEVREVAPKTILDWLVAAGFLEPTHDTDMNVDYKAVTAKGEALGLRNSRVEKGYGGRSYISVIFDANAQNYVVKNMEKIINGEAPCEPETLESPEASQNQSVGIEESSMEISSEEAAEESEAVS